MIMIGRLPQNGDDIAPQNPCGIRQLAIPITIIACYTFDVFCQRMTENGLDRSSVTG